MRVCLASIIALYGLGEFDKLESTRDAELPRYAGYIPITGDSKPTPAGREFCERLPEECRIDLSTPDTIILSSSIWRSIVRINSDTNAEIVQQSDRLHWDVEDRWDFAEDGIGDCEDIQLLKRRRLVAMGLHRRAMPMAVVLDEDGLGHAVLILHTDLGDFILDNKTSAILSWEDTGYVFIKREGIVDTQWVKLSGGSHH